MTIKEIAKKANVAKSTVSNVLNGKKCVSPETAEKVLKVCREYDYKPNFFSKHLSNSKSSVKTNIAALFLDSGNKDHFSKFYLDLLEGVITGLKQKNYDLLIYYNYDESDVLEKIRCGLSPVDGAIILSPRNKDLRISSLNQALIPYVVIGAINNKNISTIDANNKNLVVFVCKKMNENGYKNLCLLNSKPELTISTDRREGFITGMKKCGLNNNAQILCDDSPENLKSRIEEAISKGTNGFITSDGQKAKLVYDACQKLNKKIGVDVAVFSLGYSQSINMLAFAPSLSYAYQDYTKIGHQACDILIENIESSKVNHTIVESEIRWGESLRN